MRGTAVVAKANGLIAVKSPRLPQSITPRASAGGGHTADALPDMQVASAVIYLPLPTSANKMYARTRKGGVRISEQYKEWRRVAATALNVARFPSFSGSYGLSLTLPCDCGDLDNRVKCLNDLLQRRKVIVNDSLCNDIHISRSAAIERGTCRVELRHLD